MSEPRRAGVRVASLAVLLAALAGCGQKAEEAPPKVPVKGQVVNASGQGLAFVMVHLHPQAANVAGPFRAATDKQGAFSLECPPGNYKATVSNLEIKTGGGPADSKSPGASSTVPERYRAPESSPLRTDIPAGGKNDVLFKLN